MTSTTHLARALGLALAALALAAGCDKPAGAPGGPAEKPAAAGTLDPGDAGPLKPGDAAPDVTFKLHDGKEVKLSSLRGKQVLVYFYPKDDTPGCTIQAKGLRDGWADLQGAGVEVYGVSTQGAQSHADFIAKYELPFPLVVDEDGAVARAFHVPLRGDFASRQSFLVGKDGTIKQVWLEVDPKEHAAAILDAAKS
ncbi:peroxiredoxin [Sorangium sp. So ce1036]|uniref:peroxiredoxin n=1 Tax=Sorangium sp. So ce1036 TaxID=3133328 RepID=UPI003F00ED27